MNPAEQAAETIFGKPADGRAVHFAFDLGAQVTITGISAPGRVNSLLVDALGVQYRVEYWDHGDRKFAWLVAEDLERREQR